MRRFWKRDAKLLELEDELRSRRSDPPETLVRALARRTQGEARWLRPKFRVSLVAGVSLLALAAMASAGGFGVVASSSTGAAHVLYRLASSSSPQTNVVVSAADDQYKNKCGSPPRKTKCRISIGNAAAKEGDSGTTFMTFTVTLDKQSDETVTVNYTTAPIGSATQGTSCTAGVDYVVKSGTLTFAPGDTSEPITVTICGDTLKEPNETFNVNLSNPSPNAFIGNPTGTGTITNDDKP
jgi:hypothetical protein